MSMASLIDGNSQVPPSEVSLLSTLPQEMISEVLVRSEFKTKLILSVTSKFFNQAVQKHDRHANECRLTTLKEKMVSILNKKETFSVWIYDSITDFYLMVFGYNEARKLLNAIEGYDESHCYEKFARHLLQRKNDGVDDLLNEINTVGESKKYTQEQLHSLVQTLINSKKFSQAKDIIPKISDSKSRLDCSFRLAEALIAAKDMDGATQILIQATPWAEAYSLEDKGYHHKFDNLTKDMDGFTLISKCFYLANIAQLKFQCKKDEGQGLLSQALQTTESSNDLKMQIPSLLFIADIYFLIGEKDVGLKIVSIVKGKIAEITNKSALVHILQAIAKIYKNAGEDALSFDLLKEALNVANGIESINEMCEIVITLFKVSKAMHSDDQYILEMIDLMKMAAKQARERVEKENQSHELNEIDKLLCKLIEAECELQRFEEATKTLELLKEPIEQAMWLVYISSCYMVNGDELEALELIEKALEVIEGATDADSGIDIWSHLLTKDIKVDPINNAISQLLKHDLYNEALQIVDKIPDDSIKHDLTAYVLEIMLKKGDIKKAMSLLHKLLKLEYDQDKNIEHMLTIANIISKSSRTERFNLGGERISFALKLIEDATKYDEDENLYTFKIIKAKATANDFQGSRELLAEDIEYKTKMFRVIEQTRKSDHLSHEISKRAVLQTSMDDFEDALTTIEVLKDNPEFYVDALNALAGRITKRLNK